MTQERRRRRSLVRLLAGLLVAVGCLAAAPDAVAADTDPALLSPCRYRSGFGGQSSCLVVVEDVTSTRFGTGKRVYLTGAIITGVTSTTVTAAQQRVDCVPTPGHFCGAGFSYVSVTVPWTGTHRPTVGYVVRLYGSTTTGSLTPAGYVKTGDCGRQLELC